MLIKSVSSALRCYLRSMLRLCVPVCSSYTQPLRFKYIQHTGVKGIRSKKHMYEAQTEEEATEIVEDAVHLEDSAYDAMANDAMNVKRELTTAQHVLVIQPYIKWGTKRNTDIQPDDQLQEAEALIRSLPNWHVAQSLKVPLDSLERKSLFGTGKMDELKALVQQLRQSQHPLSCLFISKGTLSFVQKQMLETEFKLPVMDRYSVVIQILRLHATSAESRLQVAMAELPYIWAQAKDANPSMARKLGYTLTDVQREILKTRERKLKTELERIRNHRKLLRNKRKQKQYPIVAVVGYTNAGKTSLIKALTQEQQLQPRDQLFATLDVTAHMGVLPCNLEVLYMDTVGFMSDLPTGLIECFVATLEDAMLADVIVHVQDLAHNCWQAQSQHVERTLKTLAQNMNTAEDVPRTMPNIINVGNKIDLLTADAMPSNIHAVSAQKQLGLHELLLDIERQVLQATGRRKLKMRVPNGGREMAWLYKNAAVVETNSDSENAERLLMDVVISELAMEQFKRLFCR